MLETITKICKCGKIFQTKKGGAREMKYCSLACGIRSRTKNFDTIIEKVKQSGYQLLSSNTDYVNWRSKLKLKCPQGHEYETEWGNFNSGCRCPYCSGKRVNKVILNGVLETCGYKLLEYAGHTKLKSKFECNNGHQFLMKMNDFQQGHRCPVCINKISVGENELTDFIKSRIPDEEIISSDRQVIRPLELDVYIPGRKIAFEYCGLFFHSFMNGGKDKDYHLNKMELCRKQGVQLYQIFNDEWLMNKEICKSRIDNILGFSEKIYARKTELKVLDLNTAKSFIAINHLQGPGHPAIAYGLFNGDELVSVMSFAKTSIAKGGDGSRWELDRFCNKSGLSIIGGASKLFNNFLSENGNPVVISYCDLRWSNGNLYNRLGFRLVHQTKPNYWYIKRSEGYSLRHHRFSLRKQVLINTINDTEKTRDKTEWEMASTILDYDKIYDCGSLKFIYEPAVKE